MAGECDAGVGRQKNEGARARFLARQHEVRERELELEARRGEIGANRCELSGPRVDFGMPRAAFEVREYSTEEPQ